MTSDFLPERKILNKKFQKAGRHWKVGKGTLPSFWSLLDKGPSIYIPITSVTGWVQKMAVFADVQYCIYADILSGSKKAQKMC